MLLYVVILTYECQQSVSEIHPPPGGANRRCDCDGYRPDTLGGDVNPENSIPLNELLGYSWPQTQFMPMHAHEWFVSSQSGENFGSPAISRAPKIMPKVAKFNQVS